LQSERSIQARNSATDDDNPRRRPTDEASRLSDCSRCRSAGGNLEEFTSAAPGRPFFLNQANGFAGNLGLVEVSVELLKPHQEISACHRSPLAGNGAGVYHVDIAKI
jgi:hypothetical protein